MNSVAQSNQNSHNGIEFGEVFRKEREYLQKRRNPPQTPGASHPKSPEEPPGQGQEHSVEYPFTGWGSLPGQRL